MRFHFMINVFIICIFLYLGVLGFVYFNQRNMMYFPDDARPDPAAWGAEGAIVAGVKTSDGLNLQGWYFPPAAPENPVIIHFHGNASHFGARYPKLRFLQENGYGLLLAEYRGYGGNPGAPSEQGLYRDARAYINWLKKHQNIPENQMVLYGESLGAATALTMALEYNAKALILESPFESALAVARRHFFYLPVRFLMRDQYRNDLKAGKINAPVLVIHGKHDAIVDVGHGRRLFERFPEPKTFMELEHAGHNDLHDHDAPLHVLSFLSNIKQP